MFAGSWEAVHILNGWNLCLFSIRVSVGGRVGEGRDENKPRQMMWLISLLTSSGPHFLHPPVNPPIEHEYRATSLTKRGGVRGLVGCCVGLKGVSGRWERMGENEPWQTLWFIYVMHRLNLPHSGSSIMFHPLQFLCRAKMSHPWQVGCVCAWWDVAIWTHIPLRGEGPQAAWVREFLGAKVIVRAKGGSGKSQGQRCWSCFSSIQDSPDWLGNLGCLGASP